MGADSDHTGTVTGPAPLLPCLEEEIYAAPGPFHAPVTGFKRPNSAHAAFETGEKLVEPNGIGDAIL